LIAHPYCRRLRTWHVADPDHNNSCAPPTASVDWIKANTPRPPGSSSRHIQLRGRAVTASDAGMWLRLLADRAVSVPALARLDEHPLDLTSSPTPAHWQRTLSPGDPAIQAL